MGDHLRSLGVDFRFGTRVLGIRCSGGLITSVHARGPDGRTGSLQADWYVAAVPVEHMAQLATPADQTGRSGPGQLGKLQDPVDERDRVLFAQRCSRGPRPRDLHRLRRGRSPRSPRVSSGPRAPDRFGDGDVGGILSVDVSDWTTRASIPASRPWNAAKTEIFTEVWAQLQAHLNVWARLFSTIQTWSGGSLTPDVRFPDLRNADRSGTTSISSRFWSTPGILGVAAQSGHGHRQPLPGFRLRAHLHRPGHHGRRQRAARRAINGILDRTGSTQPRCELWPLHEPHIRPGPAARPVGLRRNPAPSRPGECVPQTFVEARAGTRRSSLS